VLDTMTLLAEKMAEDVTVKNAKKPLHGQMPAEGICRRADRSEKVYGLILINVMLICAT
jgi:hypothetical protein